METATAAVTQVHENMLCQYPALLSAVRVQAECLYAGSLQRIKTIIVIILLCETVNQWIQTNDGWPIGGNGKYKMLFSFLIFHRFPGLSKKGFHRWATPVPDHGLLFK